METECSAGPGPPSGGGGPQGSATGRPALAGLGTATVQAIGYNDLPMIQGVVLFAAFFVIIANLLVDLAYAALDPRVRYS